MKHILQTERMVFRLMERTDEAALEELDGNERVRAFFPGGTSIRPASGDRIDRDRASYAEHGFCDFIVEDKLSRRFMGRAGLHRMDDDEVDVGYLFMPQFWCQGFATEALRGLLRWARETLAKDAIPAGRIIGFAPVEHVASLRVMEKCGMTYFKTAEYQGVACHFHEVAF
jgi:RimJ/RimL family protein N-acetyltransferase